MTRVERWCAGCVCVALCLATGLVTVVRAEGSRPNGAVFRCLASDFPGRALRRHGRLEEERTKIGRVLARFLKSDGAREVGLPKHGWRILRRGSRSVLVGKVRREPPIAAAVLEMRGRGHAEGWGYCTPVRQVPRFEVAAWRLPRNFRPSSSSTTVAGRLETGTCYPGPGAVKRARRRLHRVSVRRSHRRVGVLILLRPERPLPRGHACAGVGVVVPVRIRLRGRLGRRSLVDRSTGPATVRFSSKKPRT